VIATTIVGILLALLAQLTGISRPVDPYLASVAQARSSEIVRVFDHRQMPELSNWSWGEVIGWNEGYLDPATTVAIAWKNSPVHWHILTNATYRRIGCGVTVSGSAYYFVCIVGTPASAPAPTPTPKPKPLVGPSSTSQPTVLLPDTSVD
jgi:hypothetical protein